MKRLLMMLLVGCGSEAMMPSEVAPPPIRTPDPAPAAPVVPVVVANNQLDIYKSGSRIKMQTLTTPDGAKAFLGWHDMTLDIDCQMVKATDGKSRCLPFPDSWAHLDPYFADATCQTPIIVLTACGQAPRFVQRSSSSVQCADPRLGYSEVGAEYIGTDTYWKNANSQCVHCAHADCGRTGQRYFSVKRDVEFSEFQEATVAIE